VPSRFFLLDLRADVVRAPRAAVAEAGIQRPHVACAHDEIDHPVVVPDRLDLRAVQVTVGAQQALRFIDHARAIRLAGFEEELLANRLLTGLDVELVGRTVQPCTLAGDTGIKDVADGDADLADHRAFGPLARLAPEAARPDRVAAARARRPRIARRARAARTSGRLTRSRQTAFDADVRPLPDIP
jgi:hypothetical protein